jgi:Sec-independent protein translocase protein TatA
MRSISPIEIVLIAGIAALLFWPRDGRSSAESAREAYQVFRDTLRECQVPDDSAWLVFLIVATGVFMVIGILAQANGY